MPNHVWTVPAHRMDAGAARRSILAQHVKIRGLLEKAAEVADQALEGEPLAADAVASAIGDIHATFEVHLTFEEAVLCPILNDDLPLGPERARRLHEEHHRQREVLRNLHREASAWPGLPLLAAKLASLAKALLADMIEEESALLTSDVIRDDNVTIDQCSG